jgi:flagellar protein FliO/FliZ
MVFAAENTVQPVAATSLASLLQVLLGLGLVLAAIAGTAWLLRRLAPGQVAASGSLRVVSGVAVGPKERVLLVDVDDTRLVLGVTPSQISVLHQMPRPADAESAADDTETAGPFYSRLKEMLDKKGRT